MLDGMKRAVEVWRAAAAEERKQPKIKRRRHEREFLPAALEVLDTPASPAARLTTALIAAFFVAALAWSVLGHIDTMAVADGRIIPNGRVKVVQALEIGTVRAIHVRDGEDVEAGDVLIELDTTSVLADRDRLAREIAAARVDVARLSALVQRDPDMMLTLADDPTIGRDLYAANRALLRDRLAELTAKLSGLDHDIERLRASRDGITANIDKLSRAVPLLASRVSSRSTLAQSGFGTKVAYLELKQELVEKQGDLKIAKMQLLEIEQTIQTSIQRRAELEAQFTAEANEELSAVLLRLASLTEELRKAEDRLEHKTLAAPVAGEVQQLQVHTIGGVVNPADPLLVVVPDGTGVEIEAMVLNKDIGFVAPGQDAVIKIESFPFTRYGHIEGSVVNVSADAMQDQNKGLVYAARVAMKSDRLLVGERWVPLGPGMNVTVEVKTGQRRLIEYFLSPFLRYRDEALRER